MVGHELLRRATIAVVTFAILGFSGWSPAQPASAMSCFAIAGKTTCIDAAFPAPATVMPPVVVPIAAGSDVEGDDHDIVIQDDGGLRVARG